MIRIGIVAGEASGDFLGAELITALRSRYPALEAEGIGGPQLQAAGCRILYPADELAIMGLVEVAGRYLHLRQIRKQLVNHYAGNRPDLFIGIDSPDFNLGLEKKLHDCGIRTVHYVSPSVWAWRQSRIHLIKQAVDLMLTLFPFEQQFYQEHRVPVACVGHPLADRVPLEHDKTRAREALGLPGDKQIIAIMPGSRTAELRHMVPVFLQTAAWCHRQRNDLSFVSSVLSAQAREVIHSAVAQSGLGDLPLTVWVGRQVDVLGAADAALLTSGTVTLEAMLYKLPMVIAYRMNRLTFRIIRSLVKVPYAGLPNLLAGEKLVPEFLQQDCRPESMGAAVLTWLGNDAAVEQLQQRFGVLHRQLRQDASRRAADAVAALLDNR